MRRSPDAPIQIGGGAGLARPRAVHRREVGEPPHAVEAERVGDPRAAGHFRPGAALLGHVEPDPHAPRLARSYETAVQSTPPNQMPTAPATACSTSSTTRSVE